MKTIIIICLLACGLVGSAILVIREIGNYCEDINPYNEDKEK